MNSLQNLETAPGKSVGHRTEHSARGGECTGSELPAGRQACAWDTCHPSDAVDMFSCAAEPSDG